nr:MAG TPA: hypothetical protein [Caudoviricetes sp.]
MAIANYKSFITRLGKMICKNFTDSEFVKTEFDDEFNSNTAYFTINGYSAWACIYDDDDVITVYVASTHTVEIKIDGTQKDAMATAVRRIESLLDEAEIKKAEIDKKAEEEVNADKQEAEEPQPTPEEADREVTYIDFKPEQDYSEEEQKEIAETVAGVGLELLEEQLTELEKLEEESDKADDAWDKDPLNAELEVASDKAYEKEWKQYMDAVKTLARLIDVDVKTARQMLQRGSKNREKVWNYLKRRKTYESK